MPLDTTSPEAVRAEAHRVASGTIHPDRVELEQRIYDALCDAILAERERLITRCDQASANLRAKALQDKNSAHREWLNVWANDFGDVADTLRSRPSPSKEGSQKP